MYIMFSDIGDLEGRLRRMIVDGAKLRGMLGKDGRPDASAVSASINESAGKHVVSRYTIHRLLVGRKESKSPYVGYGVIFKALQVWHGNLKLEHLITELRKTEPMPRWRAERGSGDRKPKPAVTKPRGPRKVIPIK